MNNCCHSKVHYNVLLCPVELQIPILCLQAPDMEALAGQLSKGLGSGSSEEPMWSGPGASHLEHEHHSTPPPHPKPAASMPAVAQPGDLAAQQSVTKPPNPNKQTMNKVPQLLLVYTKSALYLEILSNAVLVQAMSACLATVSRAPVLRCHIPALG